MSKGRVTKHVNVCHADKAEEALEENKKGGKRSRTNEGRGGQRGVAQERR